MKLNINEVYDKSKVLIQIGDVSWELTKDNPLDVQYFEHLITEEFANLNPDLDEDHSDLIKFNLDTIIKYYNRLK